MKRYVPRSLQRKVKLKLILYAVMVVIFIFWIGNFTLHFRGGAEQRSNVEFFILMKAPNASGTGQGIPQDDPDLLAYVRKHVLIPPSDKPYQLSNYTLRSYSQVKQDLLMLELFSNKTNGFFVECGAYNGEDLSNTLLLERDYNWTGLLIEASPVAFSALKKKHRKSWIANSCLSTSIYPEMMKFFVSPGPDQSLNGLLMIPGIPISHEIEVQCIPFGTYLLALGIGRVDYFSLDVEGTDSLILHTIPFDKIKFNVIEAEVNKLNEIQRLELRSFMDSKGYIFYGHYVYDYLFIHNSFSSILFKDLLPNYQ